MARPKAPQEIRNKGLDSEVLSGVLVLCYLVWQWMQRSTDTRLNVRPIVDSNVADAACRSKVYILTGREHISRQITEVYAIL
jgi:hypothetical protein